MNKNDVKNKFVKHIINEYSAMDENGELVIYPREDLTSFAIEAYKKGEKYFYCEPVGGVSTNPEKMIISEPIYRYSLEDPLTEEEFNLLFNER